MENEELSRLLNTLTITSHEKYVNLVDNADYTEGSEEARRSIVGKLMSKKDTVIKGAKIAIVKHGR